MAYFAAIITSDGFIVALDLRDLVGACVCVCVCVCVGGGRENRLTQVFVGGADLLHLHGKTAVISLQM